MHQDVTQPEQTLPVEVVDDGDDHYQGNQTDTAVFPQVGTRSTATTTGRLTAWLRSPAPAIRFPWLGLAVLLVAPLPAVGWLALGAVAEEDTREVRTRDDRAAGQAEADVDDGADATGIVESPQPASGGGSVAAAGAVGVHALLPLGVGLLIGTAVVAALLVAGASAVHVACVGLTLTAVALPTVWRWSQPTAVVTGVSALMVMSLATGAALAPDGRTPTDDLPQQTPVVQTLDVARAAGIDPERDGPDALDPVAGGERNDVGPLPRGVGDNDR